MSYFVSAMLLVGAVIHLLPVIGVLGAERLAGLYGVPVVEENLLIFMRHRAVLFGLLGVFLVYAAFRPEVQVPAFAGGLVSVVSFLALAWMSGGYNANIARVVAVDVVALVCLVAGAAGLAWLRRTG
jgi:uncharacterized BrkB/YihY/UPF0761 family membrane protein